MNNTLKYRLPFYRRKLNSDGTATFYLKTAPANWPQNGDTVLVSHTEVPSNSNLASRLSALSTNTVGAIVSSIPPTTPASDIFTLQTNDYYSVFIILNYLDSKLAIDVYGGGDCAGFIEYDVNPTTYSILKPVTATAVVTDVVPYDLEEGFNSLYASQNGFTGSTENVAPMFFIERNATNSIFANTLKGLNLPVSDGELMKYTRTQWGYKTAGVGTTSNTFYENGISYVWNPITTSTLPSGVSATDLITNPNISGSTGEHYETVLQTIGSYEYVTDYGKLPVPNNLYLVMEIQPNQYGEIIDGKSLKITLPYWSGTTTSSTKQYLGIYDSWAGSPKTIELYGTYNKSGLIAGYDLDTTTSEKDLTVKDLGQKIDLSQPVSNYQSNVCLLFSDTFGKPYENPTGSWSDGHLDVIDGVRVFNTTTRAKSLYDNLNDTCVGIAYLDKGFIVITHPQIVDSFYVNAFNGEMYTGGTLTQPIKEYDFYGNTALNTNKYRHNSTSGAGLRVYPSGHTTTMIFTEDKNRNTQWENTEFIYTGVTGSAYSSSIPYIEYLSYNTEKSLNIVCLASTNEFYTTTNDTAKQLLNVDPSTDVVSFGSTQTPNYPVIITQLGLHDADGNLLAVCKPTQPVKKYWYDVVSFNIKIRL
jgi:hypothetical protein